MLTEISLYSQPYLYIRELGEKGYNHAKKNLQTKKTAPFGAVLENSFFKFTLFDYARGSTFY